MSVIVTDEFASQSFQQNLYTAAKISKYRDTQHGIQFPVNQSESWKLNNQEALPTY